jgi:hypothetical protein
MITSNPLELLAFVTILTVCRLLKNRLNWHEVCTDLIDLMLNLTLGEAFNQFITLFLINIFIIPKLVLIK